MHFSLNDSIDRRNHSRGMIALHFIPFFLVLGQVKIVFQRACRNLDADLVDPFAVELIRDLGIVQLELGDMDNFELLSFLK